jgi:hypothetical protein
MKTRTTFPHRLAQTLRQGLLLTALAGLSVPALAQPATLVGYWDFNDASNPAQSVALVGGFVGAFTNSLGTAGNNPAYTADGGGASGLPGDRALNFGNDQSYRMMRCTDIAAALNAAAATDKLTVTFKQKYTGTVGSSSSFYFTAPSRDCNWRGFQAHAPWSGTTVYFDTAGCTAATAMRLSGGVGINYQQWHFMAFVKDGGAKQVLANGSVFLQQASGANALTTDFTEVLVGAAYVTGAPTPAVANNIRGLIDDFAIWQGTLTAAQLRLLAQGMTPDLVGIDSDNDGLPNGWEDLYALDKNNPADASQDPDADGLTNLQEYTAATLPRNPDTDADGLLDGVETGTGYWTSATDTGTNPLNPDTDQDLLLDGVETNTGIYVNASDTGTDPTMRDKDGDGFGDGAEVALGTSPVEYASSPSLGTGSRLLAFWDFNTNSAPTQAVDRVHSLLAHFTNGVVTLTNGQVVMTNGAEYTLDGRGHTGKPGDRALDFGTNSAQRTVRSRAIAPYLQAAAAYDPATTLTDQISISFWQKWSVVPVGSSIFWIVTPTAGLGSRGMQAHNPNGGAAGTIYFDTAGCCATGGQRVNGTAPAGFNWQQWHHFVFVKDVGTKQVWIDGKLVLSSTGAYPLPTDFTDLYLGTSYPNFTAQFLGLLDDFSVYGSALTTNQIEALAYGLSPMDVDLASGDADTDGLPDWWETFYGFNKNDPADAAQDPDNDGLTNLAEYQKKTLPLNPDTDGDGFKDGVETSTGFWTSVTDTGTDPLNPDMDGDGLLDGTELNTGTYVSPTNTGSNPFAKDSDSDLYPDYTEVLLGANPNDLNAIPYTPGTPNLLAYWDFNQATVATQTVDNVHQFVGVFEGEAAFSSDGLGRSGKTGDRAVYLGTNSTALVRNAAGAWLSAAGVNDTITVSFWEKWTTPIASIFAFYGISPSSQDNYRGISAHSPWSDGTIYWDTGGSAAGFRISANISTIAPSVPGYTDANGFFTNQWHHFAFVKNGGTKQIWLDGILFLEAANTAVLATDFTQFLIGNTWASANGFRGYMDDFSIYATALDATNIVALSKGASPIDFTLPPILAISLSGSSEVSLSWSGSGYILQVSSEVENPAGWADIAGATTSPVLQPLSGSGQKYYRLKKQ